MADQWCGEVFFSMCVCREIAGVKTEVSFQLRGKDGFTGGETVFASGLARPHRSHREAIVQSHPGTQPAAPLLPYLRHGISILPVAPAKPIRIITLSAPAPHPLPPEPSADPFVTVVLNRPCLLLG